MWPVGEALDIDDHLVAHVDPGLDGGRAHVRQQDDIVELHQLRIDRRLVLEDIEFPETVISMAVEPESSAEKDKLESMLSRLSLQDPTFTAKVDEDTGQTIISGMGELHLEVIKNRMEREFNLKIKVHKPRVT